MLGYHPISSLPVSDIDLGQVAILAQPNGKVAAWTVPFQSTTWTLSAIEKEWTQPANDDKSPSTWTLSPIEREWVQPANDDKSPSTWTVDG